MAKAIKFKNDTYLDSSSVVHDKNKLSDVLNTNMFNYNNWDKSQDINGNNQTPVIISGMSTTITTRGRALLVSFTLPLYHSGGTCWIRILVDGVKKYEYGYSLNGTTICSYTTIINNLSAGNHTVSVAIIRNNVATLKVVDYTSRNFTVTEI